MRAVVVSLLEALKLGEKFLPPLIAHDFLTLLVKLKRSNHAGRHENFANTRPWNNAIQKFLIFTAYEVLPPNTSINVKLDRIGDVTNTRVDASVCVRVCVCVSVCSYACRVRHV